MFFVMRLDHVGIKKQLICDQGLQFKMQCILASVFERVIIGYLGSYVRVCGLHKSHGFFVRGLFVVG